MRSVGSSASRGRVAVGADDGVQRRREVGVGEAVGDDAVARCARRCSTRTMAPMPDGDSVARPEVELVRRAGLELGGDDAADEEVAGMAGN